MNADSKTVVATTTRAGKRLVIVSVANGWIVQPHSNDWMRDGVDRTGESHVYQDADDLAADLARLLAL